MGRTDQEVMIIEEEGFDQFIRGYGIYGMDTYCHLGGDLDCSNYEKLFVGDVQIIKWRYTVILSGTWQL